MTRIGSIGPVFAGPLRRLMPAFALSAIGDGMGLLGVAWLAIEVAAPADRGLVVGMSVAAYTLPGAAGAVLLARPLARLAARHLIAADAALRSLVLSAIPLLYVLDALGAGVYISLLALSSLLHAWGVSGQFTLVAEHLPRESRTAGNALLSGFQMASLVVGPMLAGLAVALSSPALPIAANAFSFAVLAVIAATAGGRPEPAAGTRKTERAQGFAAIARSRPLTGLLILTLCYFFLYGPVEVALPLYVTGELKGGAGLLSLFWTVFGIGATAGSAVAIISRRLPVWPALTVAVVGWGAALAPLGLLRSGTPALVCFAVGGLLYAPYPILSATLFQEESPPELLTRVLAARGALSTLATPVGAALGGPLTTWLGAQRTLLLSGAATMAVGLTTALFLAANRLPPRTRRPGPATGRTPGPETEGGRYRREHER